MKRLSGNVRSRLAAAALTATAACTSSTGAHVATATSAGQTTAAATRTATGAGPAAHAAAQCLRDHGITGLPDPQADVDGRYAFDKSRFGSYPAATVEAAQQACAALMHALAAAQPPPPPPDAQQLAQLRVFSVCMRQHGYPDFPDPDPQLGGFSGPNLPDKADPKVQSVLRSCQPPGGPTAGSK